MNKSLKYLAILALIPLFTTGMTSGSFEANAVQSQGENAPGRIGTGSYGSANNNTVCGDVLCKDYPGGRADWEEDQKSRSSTAERQSVPQATEEELKTTEETQSVPQATEEEMMAEEYDMGSVLKLSRANVPATIPMHQGYYNGGEVHFIITDSSDPTHADLITENQG